MKLIDKDALVAEIEKRRKGYISEPSKYKVLSRIISFIDTLEVKEVDFHKELLSFYRHTNDSGSEIALAKHFYELGLKASQGKSKT